MKTKSVYPTSLAQMFSDFFRDGLGVVKDWCSRIEGSHIWTAYPSKKDNYNYYRCAGCVARKWQAKERRPYPRSTLRRGSISLADRQTMWGRCGPQTLLGGPGPEKLCDRCKERKAAGEEAGCGKPIPLATWESY